MKFGLGTEISPRKSSGGVGTAKAESKSVRPLGFTPGYAARTRTLLDYFGVDRSDKKEERGDDDVRLQRERAREGGRQPE